MLGILKADVWVGWVMLGILKTDVWVGVGNVWCKADVWVGVGNVRYIKGRCLGWGGSC